MQFNNFLIREMDEREIFSTTKNIKPLDISILFPLIIVDHAIDSILLWNEEKFKIREGESSTIFVQFNNFLIREMDEREIFSTTKNIKSLDISILFPLIIVDYGIDPILLWTKQKFKIREGEFFHDICAI